MRKVWKRIKDLNWFTVVAAIDGILLILVILALNPFGCSWRF